LLQFGADIRVNPVFPPIISPGIVEVILHVQVPEVGAVRVVGLDIGKVEEYPAVVGTMLADQLVVVMNVPGVVGLGIVIEILSLPLSMSGHGDEIDRVGRRPRFTPPNSVFRDKYFHVINIALGVVQVDAAPGPDDDVDMIIIGIIQQVSGGGDPWGDTVSVDIIPLAQVRFNAGYTVIIQVQAD